MYCLMTHKSTDKKIKTKIIELMNKPSFFLTDTCANVQCNQGRCEALSETETRCICDNGWHGQFCDSKSDY